ncbi:hypothetical protein [Chitinophaga nivalis]|uniref:DUF4476 domain-containing protein n=1 Tax=Chitinophaga nivalis TaxID=2991709 RepID=A0ABT3ISC7_9BACT|nr:hypothetical protein [Chitinophaga nivalis]MCW3463456.1 hypothetical protein [Chitinophaga nivalis]MCW3486854.1 hypothetical protein [Chitinophaga nivalis]
MYPDYQSLVLRDYEKKKAANTLSSHLLQPTPAKLKAACIAVCAERYKTKDEKVLMEFFGKKDSLDAYVQAIRRHDTDKFKPLVNYLRGQAGDTAKTNIELLAWLINFEPRPYEFGKRYNMEEDAPEERAAEISTVISQDEQERIINMAGTRDTISPVSGQVRIDGPEVAREPDTNINTVSDNTPTDTTPKYVATGTPEVETQAGEKEIKAGKPEVMTLVTLPDGDKTGASHRKIRPTIILTLLLTSIGIGTYWLLNRPSIYPGSDHGNCMFWTGDHYQRVSCNQKFKDTLVVALDSVMLHDFKRITEPDTITLNAIGHVWYIKIDGKIEFYTADGNHPIQNQRPLKPVTEYILSKYVHNN